MPPRHLVSKEVKEQILKRVKEDGVPIAQLAEEHGLKSHTIYQWISRTVTAPPSILLLQPPKNPQQIKNAASAICRAATINN
jgi:transposase-like protein